MVCDVYFCLRRKGVGDLGRKWLDVGDERIEKNIVQVCFCEGVMLSTACDVCLRRSVCCINRRLGCTRWCVMWSCFERRGWRHGAKG